MIDVVVDVVFLMEYILSQDIIMCDELWLFFVESEQVVFYLWVIDVGFNEVLGNIEIQLVDLLVDELFYLQFMDEFGCQIVDLVVIISEVIQVQIDVVINICVGDMIEFQVVNFSNLFISSYIWVL